MNKLPEYESIENCIKSHFGESVSIENKSYVGGGDINEACCLYLSNGEKVFKKSNSVKNADFFRAEAVGVNAIADTGCIGIPKLIGRGIDEQAKVSFLIMEYVGGINRVADFWETFGHELAAMHLSDTANYTGNSRFGFLEDNYIGATKQINSVRESWITFFRECRLEPQFRMADKYFDREFRKKSERLLAHISDYMPEPSQPSLLHGDLWSGNYILGNDGKAWLIDPATYVGHAEADLAMTELFGRFPERFYRAYSEINPIDSSYYDRRNLYNLYHLLNHLNLFGPSYLSAVVETVEQYID